MKIMRSFRWGNKLEKAESISIMVMIVGAALLSLGIGLTIVSTKGISAIMSMVGSLLCFLSTVSLVGVWLVEEMEKEAGE